MVKYWQNKKTGVRYYKTKYGDQCYVGSSSKGRGFGKGPHMRVYNAPKRRWLHRKK